MSLFDRLGLDRQTTAGLLALTAVATGLGFVLAASLDRNPPAVAVAAPAPVVAPDALDPAPQPQLPPVVIPQAPPGTTAPPPVQPPPVTTTRPTSPPSVTPTSPPTTSTGTTTRPSTQTTPPRAPTPTAPARPQTPGRPAGDAGDPVPFRPQPATRPLPQVVVPDAEFPVDTATATAALRTALPKAPASGSTRRDIRRIIAIAERFAATPLPGRRASIDRIVRLNAWWYSRRRAPSGRVLVRDPAGIVYSYSPGQGFAWNPVGTAGRWQRLNQGFGAPQLAATLIELGVAEVRGGRRTLNWEYYDVPDEPAAIRPGVSAMAQARIAHLMANAYRESGEQRFVDAGVEAMASLAVPVEAGGTRSMVAYPRDGAPSPWFVERAYPGADPWKGAALNGFMVAVVELRSAERALRNPTQGASVAADAAANEARRLADEGAVSLERLLPAHDSGDWSFYGLLTPGRPFRTYLANETYHCFHVSLLRDLEANYPELGFDAVVTRWGNYATRAGVSCPTGPPVTGG